MKPGRRKSTPTKRLSTSSQPRASTSTAVPAGTSRRRRYPGGQSQRVLREIRKLQKSTSLLIRKAPFGRLVSIREKRPDLGLRVREICLRYTRGVDFYWQSQALLALQELPN
ncbi:histone H3-like centromeric protein A isoform X3 [Sminthopsis crassicaudata]|uniref:histone H3-like centromeric protein A isoform X3 n=1 Tax=Sminthopsis crassicaudata TaxID=9301 RepID=UPI003D692498